MRWSMYHVTLWETKVTGVEVMLVCFHTQGRGSGSPESRIIGQGGRGGWNRVKEGND